MSAPGGHKPSQFYWAADTDYCPHGPEPERDTSAWDRWSTVHLVSDEGAICLQAPAGIGCSVCSRDLGEIVPWSECTERKHARPKRGMVPNPGAKHQPMPVWVGCVECLDRECEEYFTDDGDVKPGLEICSHVREEVSCSCRRGEGGEYALEPCPALAA